jgi:hypothetical protein
MRQQDGLGPLQVGVAGQVRARLQRLPGPARQHALKAQHRQRQLSQLAPAPQAQGSGHLVVAAPAGVQLGPGGTRQLRDPALHRGVDVLVGGREAEGSVGDLLLDHVERVEHGSGLVVVDQAAPAQAPEVGTGAGDVVGGQADVEADAGGEGHHLGRRLDAEALLPEGQGRLPWRAAHVSMPRPQRRTKPAASWWRKSSSASYVARP